MSTDLALIARTRLIAIVRLEHYDAALEVAQALLAGGISIIEFTLTGGYGMLSQPYAANLENSAPSD